MNARFSFLKRLALGVAVSLATTGAYAQTAWNATGTGSKNWFTAGNWTSGVPGVLSSPTFGSGKSTTVNIGADTAKLSSMTVSGNSYNFTGSGKIYIAGGGSLTNNGTGVRFSGIKFDGGGTLDGTGSATVLSALEAAGAVNVNGNYVLSASPIGVTAFNVASGVSTGTLTLDGFGSPDLTGIAINVGSGGTLKSTGTDPDVPGSIVYYNNATGAMQLLNGSTLGARVGELGTPEIPGYDSYQASSVAIGPTATLNLSFVSPFTYNQGDRYDILGATGAGITGSFGALTSTGGAFSPLSWTKIGNNWSSSTIGGGLFFQYQNATGELVVVPEPSTLVFAGVGVAMAGWSAWKKRRQAKA